jgi:outer membrane protein OmpA-like peptidoglycan-associated protein
MKDKVKKLVPFVLLFGISTLLFVSTAFPQEMLQESKENLEKAKAEMADVLSPETLEKAQAAYDEAVKKTQKGESLDKIRKLIEESINHSNMAIRNSELARVTFKDVLPAREKALKADAPSLAPEEWKNADSKFYEAANALERGNANDGKRKGSEARDLFSTAELLAIKEAIIGETGRYLSALEKENVNDYAPKTFAKAREYFTKADDLLDRDRYKKSEAESLNSVALYEAKHAKNLTDRIRKIDREKTSQEMIHLDFEDKLIAIGEEIDLSLRFDKGVSSQVDQLRQQISSLKEERDKLAGELADLRQEYAGTQEVGQTMKEQLEAQRVKKERLDKINALFKTDEATILQEGNKVIIRLIGFTFPSGTATVEPKYFPILNKVQKAVSGFPYSRVNIEGHTDALGDDNFNEQLSQKRADAIRTYLVANLTADPSNIIAIGYGEKKPIASNETNEGRALNRRIDVVLIPKN